jgi:hypothetical protein
VRGLGSGTGVMSHRRSTVIVAWGSDGSDVAEDGAVEMSKRSFGTTGVLAALALVLVAAAPAAQPFHLRLAAGSTEYAAGRVCSFGVRLDPRAPDVLNAFFFSNGDLYFNGPEVMTATNTSTGKSVKVNISGTFLIASGTDGSTTLTFTGPTLLEGGIVNDGRAVFTFDANGSLVSASITGKQTDLCAKLAAT